MSEPRPLLAALAVTRRAGRVLLVQRSIPPGIGKWGFPGGKVEWGETIFAAATRELHEETGIVSEPVEFLTLLDFLARDESGAVTGHFALACVLCEWRQGEGETLEDAIALGWFTITEAEALETFPDALRVMGMVIDR